LLTPALLSYFGAAYTGAAKFFLSQAKRLTPHTTNGAYDASANYVGVPLLSRQDETRHLHVSVHLPHKKGRAAAQANLQAYVNEKLASGDFDQVFVVISILIMEELLTCFNIMS